MGVQMCCQQANVPGFDGVAASPVIERPAPYGPDRGSLLVIGFQKSDGMTEEIEFARRPIGLDFSKEAPIVIEEVKPNSLAEELGVKPGWTLATVNGQSVSNTEFAYQYNVLRSNYFSLPQSCVEDYSSHKSALPSPSRVKACSGDRIFPLPDGLEPAIRGSRGDCAICWEIGAADFIAIPCGHQALCSTCIECLAEKECPLCRAPVDQFVQVFLVQLQNTSA
eukprot:gnl/TRDRNA2_/TRDRNA2_28372_c0_seq1.p1 gnl/TRDRNA2_/TRDRNA2_28372_c0~~gnl/TRDRNA2_/TRDRNA2_28372_c0_seq1.p1  ORF type:complete len:223 (+),score=27.04 gnl/TRDRNA2_/TRDRNA2_28372_c0_seq1:49-717(+)